MVLKIIAPAQVSLAQVQRIRRVPLGENQISNIEHRLTNDEVVEKQNFEIR
jgi:hypothetical protein